MSEGDHDKSEEQARSASEKTGRDGDKPDICRDYLRGMCSRGNRCRFAHPDDESFNKPGVKIEFCHDYQNPGGCRRWNCRFVHATKQEELIYRESGRLPSRVQPMGDYDSDTPVCKDFMYGRCDRNNCKYRHVTQSEFDFDQMMKESHLPRMPRLPPHGMDDPGMGPPGPYGGYDDRPPPRGPKRMRSDYYDADIPPYGPGGGGGGGNGGLDRHHLGPLDAPPPLRVSAMLGDALPPPRLQQNDSAPRQLALEEENFKLREKIRALEKQVNFLSAANEVLLEQNARIRIAGNSGSGSGATVSSMSGGNVASQAGGGGGGPPAMAVPAVVSVNTMQPPPQPPMASMPMSASIPSSGLVSYPIVSMQNRL